MSDDIIDEVLDDIAGNSEVSKQESKAQAVQDSREKEIVQVENIQDETVEYFPGCGVDIGTSNIVVARRTKDGTFVNRFHRNMLYPLDISEEAMDLLEKSSYLYVKVGEKYFVVGEDALTLVNAIGKGEIVRPMQNGIINPSLQESTDLLFYIIKAVVGDPIVEGETLRFSVPADPVDANINNKFHEMILGNFFSKMGYDAKPVNEAMCIAYDCNPVMKEDGKDVPLSGITCSCLTPEMPVITHRGIVPISKIHRGDRVITHRGSMDVVMDIIPSKRVEIIQNIDFWSSNIPLRLTKDHLVYVKREGIEGWLSAQKIQQGDKVMTPSLRYLEKKQYIRFQRNVTSSKKKNVEQIPVTEKVAKLIGLFLGDGQTYVKNGGVFFDFGRHEESLCDFVRDTVEQYFGNKVSFIRKGEGSIRCQMNNKGFSKWLKQRCYSEDGNKQLPWKIDEMNRSIRLGLLSGLLESDGYFGEKEISFENTSSQLTLLVMQLCNSEGITGSYSERRRVNEHLESKVESYLYSFVVHRQFVPMLHKLLRDDSNLNFNRSETDIRQWNTVKSNQEEYYDGNVYDLVVSNDHSFCVPGCCVHNCGGGMWNLALSYKGLSIVEFSCTRSGDYLDEQVATMTGVKKSKVIKVKERKLDLGNVDMSDRVQAALSVYYDEMVERMVHHISQQFKDLNSELDGEVEVVVAGGTSMAPGFCERLETAIKGSNLSFDVYRIRHSETPFYSVSQGACIRAQADYNKKS
jgi:hypothetical protein